MDRQTIDLGFILRQFKDYKFGMETINDRLLLQKFIYLLQAHDIYLGYDYSWYLRGPYCTTLAKRGFALKRVYEQIPSNAKSVFVDSGIQEKFDRFKKFITGNEMNIDYLEILASLHILKIEGLDKDNAVGIVHAKKPNVFTNELCREIWDTDVQNLSSNVRINDPPGCISSKARLLDIKVTPGFHVLPLQEQSDIDDNTLDMTGDMMYKPTDQATYYMIKDATTDNDFHLVGKNMFRPDEPKPNVDLLMIDKAVAIKLYLA